MSENCLVVSRKTHTGVVSRIVIKFLEVQAKSQIWELQSSDNQKGGHRTVPQGGFFFFFPSSLSSASIGR